MIYRIIIQHFNNLSNFAKTARMVHNHAECIGWKKSWTYLGVLGWEGFTAEDGKCWDGLGGGLLDDGPLLPNCSLGLYWYQGQFYCQTQPHIWYSTFWVEGHIFQINQSWRLRGKHQRYSVRTWILPYKFTGILKKLCNFLHFFLSKNPHLDFNFVDFTFTLNFVTNYRFCRHLVPPRDWV